MIFLSYLQKVIEKKKIFQKHHLLENDSQKVSERKEK